jgi:predicted PurR-regulated permease PerM
MDNTTLHVSPLTTQVQASRLLSTGIFLTGLAASIALLYFGRAFCITLVVSVILAFMLEPFVFSLVKLGVHRAVSSFVVCTVGILLLYLVGVGIFTQLADFSEDLPYYSQRVNTIVDSVADRIERAEENAYRLLIPKRFQRKEASQPDAPQQPPPTRRRRTTQPTPPPQQPPAVQEVRIQEERTPIVNFLYGYVSSFYNALLMASFVPFLVYFMLSWRDHIRKSFLAMFEGPDRLIAGRAWQSIAEIARAYVVGNVILGILLSLLSCILFWSWHLPYWILVGFLSGFCSLVPYVGLPLALIAPMAATLMTYDAVTPYLIIGAVVAFLHLLGLNLLYPSIVGARVHLNPLAVTIALMFWGTIWGAIGLILAIPLTAGAKAIFDNVESLKPYGMLLGD